VLSIPPMLVVDCRCSFLQVAEITDRFLVQRLNEEQDPKVLATLCLGIAKLIIAGIARDTDVRSVSKHHQQ